MENVKIGAECSQDLCNYIAELEEKNQLLKKENELLRIHEELLVEENEKLKAHQGLLGNELTYFKERCADLEETEYTFEVVE